jgi:hypothetical protein
MAGFPVFCADKTAAATVYVIKQKTRQGGVETLYLSDTAVRNVQENAGRVTLAHAPQWNSIVLNTANHTYFDSKNNTQATLMQRYMLFEGGDFSKCKWQPVEKAKIGSLDAERIVDAGLGAKTKQIGYENVPEELKVSGFWVASNLKIPAAAANMVARLRGCPQVGKLPLRFVHVTKNNNRAVIIDTLSCEKKNMPQAAMSIPVGYKRSLTEYDGSLKDSNMLDELFPQFGKKRK